MFDFQFPNFLRELLVNETTYALAQPIPLEAFEWAFRTCDL